MRRALFAIILLATPLSAHAQLEPTGPDCSSIPECLAILRNEAGRASPYGGINAQPIQRAVERLSTFGDDAVVALLPLLSDDNQEIRNRASYTLSHFSIIDARHDDALIAAHRTGLGWLIRPIARTGTDNALDYLWEDFLDDSDYGSNSQQFYALPMLANGSIRASVKRSRNAALKTKRKRALGSSIFSTSSSRFPPSPRRCCKRSRSHPRRPAQRATLLRMSLSGSATLTASPRSAKCSGRISPICRRCPKAQA
jgi:hypothetical protein